MDFWFIFNQLSGKYIMWQICHWHNLKLCFVPMKIKCSDKWFKCSNFCQINIVCCLALSKQRREWTVDEEWKVSCNILSFELSRYRSIALLISFYRKSHENFKCGIFVCGQIRYNYFFHPIIGIYFANSYLPRYFCSDECGSHTFCQTRNVLPHDWWGVGWECIDSEDSVDVSVLLTRGCTEAAQCRVPTRAQ